MCKVTNNSLILQCWQWLSCYRPVIIIRDQYEVLCLGLSGAGKTTALSTLVGEPAAVVEPTTGSIDESKSINY